MFVFQKLVLGGFAMVFLMGCGSGETCPPDFPERRDGFCYRADGGAMMPDGAIGMDGDVDDGGDAAPGDAAPGDGGASDGAPSDGAVGDGAPPTDGGVICVGTHPLLDGARRYCGAEDCYCPEDDTCFVAEISASCCPVDVVCGTSDGGVAAPDGGATDGGAICVGVHPLVEGDRRFCEAGDCYCGDPDSCYPAEIAATCCTVAVTCE